MKVRLVTVMLEKRTPMKNANVIVKMHRYLLGFSEAIVGKCSIKKVFLKISKNSQDNTCVKFSFLTKLQHATLF